MKIENQVELFGAPPVRYEYYPVLVPDAEGLKEIADLNQMLIEHGVKPSQLTKLPHISIDGVICPENDSKVKEAITAFLSSQKPVAVAFTEIGFYPGRGGITLKLGVENAEEIKEFNKNFMIGIGGKITRLDPHLTLARYVHSGVFDRLKQSDIIHLKSCICASVAIYKKEYKAKGAYEVIGRVEFGDF